MVGQVKPVLFDNLTPGHADAKGAVRNVHSRFAKGLPGKAQFKGVRGFVADFHSVSTTGLYFEGLILFPAALQSKPVGGLPALEFLFQGQIP